MLLVTGSRGIGHGPAVERILDGLAAGGRPARLIHGGAAGVDTLAAAWARQHDIPTLCVRPRFVNKKNAYLARDRQMVDMADVVVAIWDGESKGTKYAKDYAADKGKLLKTALVFTTDC